MGWGNEEKKVKQGGWVRNALLQSYHFQSDPSTLPLAEAKAEHFAHIRSFLREGHALGVSPETPLTEQVSHTPPLGYTPATVTLP